MGSCAIKVKNLSKKFGGVSALDSVSLTVQRNTIVGVIGPNGAGKTTFFNLLSGFIKPDEGEIFVDDQNITNWPAWQRAQLLSRTFQLTRNFTGLSVMDNILLSFESPFEHPVTFLAFRPKHEEQVRTKINQFLANLKIDIDPNKFAAELSYGQNKLIELVRSILKKHTVLLLDEPVAGVNPEVRSKLSEMLKIQKEEGDTVVLIEHDIEFVMNTCDYVFAMAEGRIIAQGTPHEVRNNPEVLKSYLGE